MPRRLRLACGGNTEQLRGIAGMDETCIGGKEANKRKNKQTPGTQGGRGKQTVVGMRERGGRAKAESIAKTDIAAMNRASGEAAEFGATIHTDDHPAYNRLHTACQHGTVNHSAKAYVNGLARQRH